MAHAYALAELVGSPPPSPTILAAESCPAVVAGASEKSGSDASLAPNTMGARISDLMARKGFKGSVIARQLGLDPALVSRWAHDQFPVPHNRLTDLAAALGTTVDYLTGETKCCTLCGRELPISEFPRDRGHPYPRCKTCRNAASRDARRLLGRDVPPTTDEPTKAPPPWAPPWQPHHGGAYVSLVPCGPMGGRVPRVNGRWQQAYGSVGRIADL